MGRDKKFSTQDLWQATHELIVETGYQGFSMSLLATKLHVSRAAIYKHYPNKEELLIEFMVEKIRYSVTLLSEIDFTQRFEEQLRDLLERMFQLKDLHQILGMASTIEDVSPIITEKKQILSTMHHKLYAPLNQLIDEGKKQGFIAPSRNNFLLLGFIFQTIDIPNHAGLPLDTFIAEIQDLILHGISNK
ncbi:TetR/AcrR family transcriptional regulator [Kurthia huakuii]|nr:TetR/AcrR family transcriptional regulator [Kurthia huakuii]